MRKIDIDPKGKVYSFKYDTARGFGTPALRIGSIASANDTGNPQIFYLFGALGGANSESRPLRWSVAGGVVFTTFHSHSHFVMKAPSLDRYPISGLISAPDDGRWPLDLDKLGGKFDTRDGSPPPNYDSLRPMVGAFMDASFKTSNSKLPLTERLPEVWYDVRGLDAIRVELYMTVNGRLSRWLFDGKDWTLKENYGIEVEGPFLVCNNGTSLVTARDGHWCLLEEIDTENFSITPIVTVSETDPLRLIEDRSAGKAFFELGEDIFDASGKRIARIPKSVESNDRLREIVRNIRAERERH